MAAKKKQVTGGVYTHSETHHAAVVHRTGRVLGDRRFPATAAGYRALLAWLGTHGTVVKAGLMVPTRHAEDLALGQWAVTQQLGGVPKCFVWDNEGGVGRYARAARHADVRM